MSALDFTARALALRATALTPLTFPELQQASLPATVDRIASSGHAEPGIGAAVYISDALASAELQASHPAAVVRERGGRYFRLAWQEQGCVTPEQFGWTEGETGTGQIIVDAFKYMRAVAATPGNGSVGVVGLTAGRAYLLSDIAEQPVGGGSNLTHGRCLVPPGCVLRGNGAKLKAATAAGKALVMAQGEILSKHVVTGPMAAGANVFQLATVDEAAQFTAGDTVRWKLGDDPIDPLEPLDWGYALVKAVGTGSGQITLDRGIPKAWDGTGSTSLSNPDGSNVNLDRILPLSGKVYDDLVLEGLGPDPADHVLRGVRFQRGWGVTFDNIRGQWCGATMAIQSVEDFHGGYVEAKGNSSTGGTPAVYGRGLTLAESRGRIDHLAVSDCYRYGVYCEFSSDLVIGYFHDVVSNDSAVTRHRGLYANTRSRVHVERALFQGCGAFLSYEEAHDGKVSFGTARVEVSAAPQNLPVPGYNCDRLELSIAGTEELYVGSMARWIEQTIWLTDGMAEVHEFAPGCVIACLALFGGGAVAADFASFGVGRTTRVNMLAAIPAAATSIEQDFVTAFAYGSIVAGAKPRFGAAGAAPGWTLRHEPAQVVITTASGSSLAGSGKFVRVRMLIVPDDYAAQDEVLEDQIAREQADFIYEGKATSTLNASIAAGATVSQTVAVTGLAAGDLADASFSAALGAGLTKTIEAVASGVKISLTNASGSAKNGPAGMIFAQGRKRRLIV